LKKHYIKDIQKFKQKKIKFATITAYDYLSAKVVESLDFPLILVGDSASMVVYGYNDTTPVSMDEMLLVLRAVVRGAEKPLIVADMPFLSYQPSIEEALKNAGKFIKAGANAVKLEGGGRRVCGCVQTLVDSGIPVMGHIGLMPQSINVSSGYSIQGKTEEQAEKIIREACHLEQSGVFSLVLEGVPENLAELITKKVSIPTIGIGSGVACDGQIQVFHDVLGFDGSFLPKHAKKYLNGYKVISQSLEKYKDEVKNMRFPGKKHSVSLDKTILKKVSENN